MNLNQFRASFSPEALAGGEQVYAAGGVVRIVRGLSGRVYATVRDRGADAHVAAALDRDGTVSELNCSCASPRFCRHQAALLTALAAAPADEAFPGGVRPCLFPGRGFAALCPEYLTAAARGPETQAEARRICGMDRVRVVSDEALPGGLRTVSARVGSHNRFSSGEEDVSLTLLPGGLPQKGLCGCMPDGGEFLCQHMTALLLTLFPDDTAPDVETSAPARRLLAAAAAAALPDPRTEGGLRLVPELSFDIGEQPRLSFRVGRDKLWTVRSVDEFLDNVRAGRTAAFGRGAAFRLDVDAFDEAGRAMIRFLRAHRRGDGFAPRDGAGLPLNESSIDDFFDALGGAELLFDGTPLRTVRRDPPAALTVSPAGRNGCALRFSGPAPRFVGAGEYCYVVADGALYASTREFCRLAAELLRSLCAAGETGLLLSLSDLGPFWTGVLLPVRDQIPVRFSDPALERFVPPALKIAVRLRPDGPDGARAAMDFLYGDRVCPAFSAPEPGGPVRDLRREARAEQLLREYLPHWDGTTREACIRGDAGAVFELVRSGLPRLSALADVSLSPDFGRAAVRPRADARVSLDTAGGLVDLNVDVSGYTEEELAQVLRALARGQRFTRFSDGSYADLSDEGFRELDALYSGLLADPGELSARMKLPRFRLFYLDAMAGRTARLAVERSLAFRRAAGAFEAPPDADGASPQGFTGTLRPHQAEGFLWMRTIERWGFGGVLADDMGLGKTVQALALLLSPAPEGRQGLPGLIVCPTSLVRSWAAECRRFAPELDPLIVAGSTAARAAAAARAPGRRLVITSYDSLKRDAPLYAGTEFRAVIADEAQFIKNRSTQAALAVKSLRAGARFALTGTPVENRPSELWSLFDFLMPGYLGRYADFRARFEIPAGRGDREALERLRRLTAPFLLRRVKRDVLRELPEKTDAVLYTRLAPAQKRAYDAVAAALVAELRQRADEASLLPETNMAILTMLLRLRQICCHPPLCLGADYAGGSSKLALCTELISSLLAQGHRILLFSQFTSMLDVLAAQLDAEGVETFLLTGRTPPEERLELVSRFNGGQRQVFLISLKAGGTGLNLTGADAVIHYDPWWNTAAQNQATDRAHRIGQDRHVFVYRLIAENTIEQKILDLQEKKAELAAALVDGGDGAAVRMTPRELLALFEDGSPVSS